ncbi:hypothetical protein [Sporosarcina sp. FSL K6-3508]|uniref:hypothetical protein n=1 Tax=Sporosarcina sp. FSL K6-3508 TaxID=2921557 RepID=UPI00315B38DC
MRTYVKEVIIGALVLIVISLSLIILLESNVEVKKILDFKTVVLSLSTFGGAGLGALIAGQLSVALFKKNIKHEEDKRQAEQIVKKAIYLNDYLKDSWSLMEVFRAFNFEFFDLMKSHHEQYPDKQKLNYEIERFSPVLNLLTQKNEQLLSLLRETKSRLERSSYDHINDFDFIKMISENKFLLTKIEAGFEKVNDIDSIESFPDLWIIQELISSLQRYLNEFEHFEKMLREYK